MSKIKKDKQTNQGDKNTMNELQYFIQSKKKQNDALKKVIEEINKKSKNQQA